MIEILVAQAMKSVLHAQRNMTV
eukprot:COSAG02_NODE_1933_length_10319_cov_22.624168_1_plen_22_part_10